MLQIKIEQTNRIEKETGLTCLDDCIATLAHYYGCHYEMMYADGFAILGNGCECRFASSYFIRLVNGPRNLTDYHGLTLHKKGPFTKRRMKKLIRDEIEEGRPVLLLFDPFWCPWDWGFQQYSNEEGHCFLVADVTEEGLVCVDPYFEKEAELLPFEYFQEGIRGIYLVEYTGERSVSADEYKECLEKLFVHCKDQKYFEGLRSLIDELAYRDNIFNEVPSDELFWRSPLVGILLRMNQSIQSISGFVRYVAGELENEDLMALGERIWNLAITWKQARKLITKLYLALGDENKGILYTGDLGYKDNEGFLYIRGRKSRFGKVYGKRIDLAYLEIQLECELQIHAVLLSDDKKIFIYTDSGKWQSAAKYIQLKTGFPSHVLECKELAELPRNESGKVRRHLCSIYH